MKIHIAALASQKDYFLPVVEDLYFAGKESLGEMKPTDSNRGVFTLANHQLSKQDCH